MFTAYLDESGHETKDWQFIAGFLGDEDQWKQFVPLWQEALGPQRKHLHMTDLRWDKDYTRRLLQRLGAIPDQCKLTRVLGGARVKDYEDLVAGTISEKLLKGYIASLYPLVINTLRVIPPNERLELVFEEQKEYEPFVHRMLSEMVTPHPAKEKWMFTNDGLPKLAKWSFVPKGSTILTDPADYFSYALLQLWRNRESKRAEWCRPIRGDGTGIGRIMRRNEIRKIIQTTQVDMFYAEINARINLANRRLRP